MITKFTSLLLLAALSTAAQISNTNLPFSQNSNERDQAFGKVVGDSTINDPDSLDFKYNNKEAFYEAAQSDNSLLQLGNSNDLLYQQEFANLEQSNIGKYQEVKQHLQKNETSDAIQKLSAIVDLNLKEQHLKTVNSIIALLYDPAMDTDSDTVAILSNIAYLHPFYGGEAVYIARAILHLDVQDQLPALRRGINNQNNVPSTSPKLLKKGITKPNPANNIVNFTYPLDNNVQIRLLLFNTYGEKVKELELMQINTEINIESLKSGVYFLHVIADDIEIENHKLVIVK